MNRLFYGDNLDVLRNRRDFPDESVNLIYLDPPFNSNRSYNILFQHKSGEGSQGQIEAFDDTWRWGHEAEELYDQTIEEGAPRLVDALVAFRRLLGTNDMLAYIVMMAPRLVEMRRVLKSTGTIFLHCDPTASHYLKALMDSIFDPSNFRNEIVWHYNTGGKGKKGFLRKHDIILWYSKGPDYLFNREAVAVPRSANTAHLRHGVDEAGREYYEDYSPRKSGRQYRWYLDEGVTPMDVWTDIQALNPMAAERLGYPTQKPVALLERIIVASSKPGDVVLDPFCGCGTTVDAAQRLDRNWLGIDITYLSIDLIQRRLADTFRPAIRDTYEVRGVPRELEGAQALFDQNAFDFERWAVSLVNGTPNEKQVGDRGIDGRIQFHLNRDDIGNVLVSVKGGTQLNPAMVRDLRGTVERERAEMGVLLVLGTPTRGMVEEANRSGSFDYAFSGARFPKIQIVSVADLLRGVRLSMPTPIGPYRRAKKRSGQMDLLAD